MAPEQSEGHEAAEPADLYALALVLYEGLAGVNPVRGADAGRDGAAHRQPARAAGAPPRRSAALAHARDRPRAAAGARAAGHARGPARGARAGACAGLRRPRRRAAPPRVLATRRARAAAIPTRILQETASSTTTGSRGAPPAERRPAPPARPIGARRSRTSRIDAAAPPRAAARGVAGVRARGDRLAALRRAVPAPRCCCLPPPLRWCCCHAAPGSAGSTAALAPALGLVGLAGAFPALAGQRARLVERAALAALGYWWLILAEPLLDRRLWLGVPAGTPARAVWEGSLSSAATHVVGPSLSLGVLLRSGRLGAGRGRCCRGSCAGAAPCSTWSPRAPGRWRCCSPAHPATPAFGARRVRDPARRGPRSDPRRRARGGRARAARPCLRAVREHAPRRDRPGTVRSHRGGSLKWAVTGPRIGPRPPL